MLPDSNHRLIVSLKEDRKEARISLSLARNSRSRCGAACSFYLAGWIQTGTDPYGGGPRGFAIAGRDQRYQLFLDAIVNRIARRRPNDCRRDGSGGAGRGGREGGGSGRVGEHSKRRRAFFAASSSTSSLRSSGDPQSANFKSSNGRYLSTMTNDLSQIA